MYKKHFNIDLINCFDKTINYYFNDKNDVYLLLLKYENITEWSNIITNHLPYKFVLKHSNNGVNSKYIQVKQKINFTKEEIQIILDNDMIKYFYTDNEIKNIYNTFCDINN